MNTYTQKSVNNIKNKKNIEITENNNLDTLDTLDTLGALDTLDIYDEIVIEENNEIVNFIDIESYNMNQILEEIRDYATEYPEFLEYPEYLG